MEYDKTDIDPLSELAFKYMSDKCPQIKHPFTPVYFELLKEKRESTKKVLEIGIGWREMALKWRDYQTGASLFMWREFFPNAQIYGIDIEDRTLINDDRITTFLCDQTDEKDLTKLIDKIGNDIDLIIDDGSHITEDQIFSCKTFMPIVKKDVIYIVEDVKEPNIVANALNMYKTSIPALKRRFKDDNIVVVTNN